MEGVEGTKPTRSTSVQLSHTAQGYKRNSDEEYGSMNRLPLELLVFIFQYAATPETLHEFMNLRLVNSRFSITLLQEQVWKEIFLSWFFGRTPAERQIGVEHIRTWRPTSWFQVCQSRLLAWARRLDRMEDNLKLSDIRKRAAMAQKTLKAADKTNLEKLKTGIKSAVPTIRRFSNSSTPKTLKGQLKGMIRLEHDRRELTNLEYSVNFKRKEDLALKDGADTSQPKLRGRRVGRQLPMSSVGNLFDAVGAVLPWAGDPLRMIEDCPSGLGLLEREILHLKPEEINEAGLSLSENQVELQFNCPLTLQGSEKYLKSKNSGFESSKKLFCTLCRSDVHVVSDVEELIALKESGGNSKACIRYVYASPQEVEKARGVVPRMRPMIQGRRAF